MHCSVDTRAVAKPSTKWVLDEEFVTSSISKCLKMRY